MKNKNFRIGIVLLMISISFISATAVSNSIPIQIQTLTDSGNPTTGTFTFKIDISNSNTCTPILYTDTETKTTDSRGVVTYNLEDVNLDFDEQYWFCYYRDGVLKDTIKAARVPYTFMAKNVTSSGIVADANLNLGDYNITAENFFGNIGQNINVSGNISIGNKITFNLGEIIDNLIDGIVRVTGDLNVSGRIQDKTGDITPPGSVVMYGGTSAPTGWLIADGTAVSRITYADLFTSIGTTYGTGDGSTTFNLPNMTLRFPLGNNGSLGTSGGSTTITTSNMPSHSHTATGLTFTGNAMGTHHHSDSFSVASHDHAITGGLSAHSHRTTGTAGLGTLANAAASSNTAANQAQTEATTPGSTFDNVAAPAGTPDITGSITAASAGTPAGTIGGSTATSGTATAYYQLYTIVNYIIKY